MHRTASSGFENVTYLDDHSVTFVLQNNEWQHNCRIPYLLICIIHKKS